MTSWIIGAYLAGLNKHDRNSDNDGFEKKSCIEEVGWSSFKTRYQGEKISDSSKMYPERWKSLDIVMVKPLEVSESRPIVY